jgi:hypothetical protein
MSEVSLDVALERIEVLQERVKIIEDYMATSKKINDLWKILFVIITTVGGLASWALTILDRIK